MSKRTFNSTILKTRTDDWLTPPELIKSLGEFDLDPCSPEKRPWDTAKNHMSFIDNGLMLPWTGRVWLNPPYSDLLSWLNRAAMHQNVTALVFTRTETRAFQEFVFPYAHSLLFINGRIFFHDVNGIKAKSSGGAASVLISYDEYNSEKIAEANIKGFHVSTTPDIYFISFDEDKRTWKVILGSVMNELPSGVPLPEIYDKVVEMAPKKVKNNKHYKAKIRQTLQYYYINAERGIWKN